MREVFVAGVGMTAFGRFPDETVRSLTESAVRAAITDAGTDFAAIEGIAFGNSVQDAIDGQFGIRGQVALANLPLGNAPIFNVENACASATTAFNVAMMQIQSGAADIALAVGAEKMSHPDSKVSMEAFQGSWDRAGQETTVRRLLELAAGMPTPPEEMARESARSVFMDIYSAFAKYHMARFGTTQRHLAAVAAKNHVHSIHNERAQYRKAFSIDEVLSARLICWPFTLPMCSPISDGAAAAVLCSKRAVDKLGIASRAIRVRSAVMMAGGRRGNDDIEAHISRQAALKAYENAGVGPDDVDVVECHDATAFGEIQQSENLGFFSFGDGGPAAERGDTELGGRIPFNPSGGLESKGHPIGATGLGQIFELVSQLRGECGSRQVANARIALQENGGGLMHIEEAAVGVTILERP